MAVLVKNTLIKLEEARQTGTLVKLEDNVHVKKLIKALQEEHLVQEKHENLVQVNKSATNFSAFMETISTKKNELTKWAAVLLPTITGHLIIFTRMGIMTHHEANKNQIGGQIIGIAY